MQYGSSGGRNHSRLARPPPANPARDTNQPRHRLSDRGRESWININNALLADGRVKVIAVGVKCLMSSAAPTICGTGPEDRYLERLGVSEGQKAKWASKYPSGIGHAAFAQSGAWLLAHFGMIFGISSECGQANPMDPWGMPWRPRVTEAANARFTEAGSKGFVTMQNVTPTLEVASDRLHEVVADATTPARASA